MAALVIAAAGSALGGSLLGTGVVALGLTGNAIGYLAGSLVASAFAPTQKSQGPRLSDLQVSSSAYGTPIAYVAGSPRLAGQIVWASAKREIATTTSQGKGGGGAEYTSYTYEVDLLIELADVITAGVTRIWRDGELVWSGLGNVETLMASGGTAYWRRMTSYGGGPTQLPDPTYEAAVGSANAPAYRGRTTVMLEGLQLGAGGNLPNLTFELGTSRSGTVVLLSQFNQPGTYAYVGGNPIFTDRTEAVWRHVPSTVGPEWTIAAVGRTSNTDIYCRAGVKAAAAVFGAGGLRLFRTPEAGSGSGEYSAAHMPLTAEFAFAGDFTIEFVHSSAGDAQYSSVVQAEMFYAGDQATTGSWSMRNAWTGTGRAYRFDIIGSIGVVSADTPVGLGVYTRVSVTRTAGVLQMYINGVPSGASSSGPVVALIGSGNLSLGARMDGAAPTYNFYSSNGAPGIYDELLMVDGLALYSGAYTVAAGEYGPATEITISGITPTTVAAAVADLCERSGLAASQYDVSALASITTPLRALAVGQVSSARAVLEMLASAYFFTARLSDKIYFVPLGAAAVATVPYVEMAWSAGGDTPPASLQLQLANELEIPAQMALTYANADADHQTDTQYSDRLLTGQDSTSVTQLPLSFTASEAKAIADATVVTGAVRALSTTLTLGEQYAALEAGDAIIAVDEDASQYRLLVQKLTDADGVRTLDCVLDDASALTQAGVTSGGTMPQTLVYSPPTTTLELLDIPILRDADNLPGFYVAVDGSNSRWTSAGLYDTVDDTTYNLLTTIGEQTVIGGCISILPSWSGFDVFDDVSTLTVSVRQGELVSATRDEVLNSLSVNAALIGSEIVQFRDATLVSAGVYTLSGFLRGRRGTRYAMASHGASERFVQLGTNGLRFVALQTSDLGKLRYYKAASAGQRLSNVVAKTITPLGQGLECFAGTDARANRNSADTVITWRPGTRLSTRLVGPLGISAPQSEPVQSFEVEFYTSAAFTILKRTIAASAASVTYTSAMQITDYGFLQTVLYLRIYQLSATVGRGIVYQATI